MIYTTPSQMKYIEALSDKKALTYPELMDNAANEIFRLIMSLITGTDSSNGVVILCGHGNNGADGFTAAKKTAVSGIKTTVVLCDGAPASQLAKERYIELSSIQGIEILNLDDDSDKARIRASSADLIADSVYGIGFRGNSMPPSVNEYFEYIKGCRGIKIAVDIPSGGNALNGETAPHTIKADYTVTFGNIKTGMLVYPLKEYCGEIITGNIGLTDGLYEGMEYLAYDVTDAFVRGMFPERKPDSHKGDFGKLMIIAGCSRMSGAAVLQTLSALRSGTGLVSLASTDKVISRAASSVYEATFLPLDEDEEGLISSSNSDKLIKAAGNMTALAIGCGLGVSDSTKKIVQDLLINADCPIILDADGINCISDNINIIKNTKNKLIITPHEAELERIINASGIKAEKDRLSRAAALAREYDIIVAAKGVPTFIAGNGRVYVCGSGNPGLSKGGSGDVLAGITAGFAAQGLSPLNAAVAGVYVHSRAAGIAAEKSSRTGMLPSDVINELPYVFREWNR